MIQADEVEKGHQVGQMKDIYAKADKTLIWFGKALPNSALSMEFA